MFKSLYIIAIVSLLGLSGIADDLRTSVSLHRHLEKRKRQRQRGPAPFTPRDEIRFEEDDVYVLGYSITLHKRLEGSNGWIHDVTYGPPEKCYIHSVSDIPALLMRDHGEGSVALLPFQIGAMYREWGNQSHTLLAIGTLDNLLATGRRLRVDGFPGGGRTAHSPGSHRSRRNRT